MRKWVRGWMVFFLSLSLVSASAIGQNSSISKQISVVKPKQEPETAAQLIDYFSAKNHKLFKRQYLIDVHGQMVKDSQYLGDKASIDAMSLSLFRQWLYLQLYSNFRKEYFLVNVTKTLSLSQLSSAKALKVFDKSFPASMFKQTPQLKKVYLTQRQNLKTTLFDPVKRRELKEFTRGQIESGYLTIAAIEKRNRLLAKRFSTSDDRYKKESTNLDRWQKIAEQAQGIMATRAFTKRVRPYLAETSTMLKLTERASAEFVQDFEKKITARMTITDFADFISGDRLHLFGQQLASAMQTKDQMKFRKRIEKAFPLGIRDIMRYQQGSLKTFKERLKKYDFVENVSLSNTRSAKSNKNFHDWLVLIFQEQTLHWVITEEYPFMKTAADDLVTLVNQRMSQKSMRSAIRLSLLTTLMAVTPLTRMGNRFSSWMSKRFFQGFRGSIMIANSYLLSDFAFQTYLQYSNWRNIRKLARLNPSGDGLMTQATESASFWNMMIQGGMTGVSAITSLGNLKNFFLSNASTRTFSSPVARAAASTWNAQPVPMKTWLRDIRQHSAKLKRSLLAAQPKAVVKHMGLIGLDVAAIFTQMIVMVPASLPTAVKSFLGSVPKQIYNGVTLGTVIGVMGVTVQSYITALGLKSFVWAFDQLGYVPPAYWQQNTLNVAERVDRDAIIRAEYEMANTKANISNLLGFITTWEALLAQGGLTSVQQRRLRAAIANGRQNINNLLKIQLLRWYLLFELRKHMNSAMRDMGFGLDVSPNLQNPSRMTISLTLGGEIYAYSATAMEIERLRDRVVVPNSVDTKELLEVARRLKN